MISQGNSAYYLYNGHGDVVQLYNGSGTLTREYDYDAFGNEVSPNAGDTNPFRYAGQYFDVETGTYYLRARYYDPSVGRFTQQDGWAYADPSDPLSLNLYTYCFNDPVQYVDFSGNIPVETIVDIGSLAVSAVEFAITPGLGTGINLLWDTAALLLPYVPGSYVSDAAKLTGRLLNEIPDAKKGLKISSEILQKAIDGDQLTFVVNVSTEKGFLL